MTKILITGSSGYIGSCLNKFFRNNKNIYLIDKDRPKQFDRIKNTFFKCDLTNIKKLEIILSKVKPDIIIHLAARSTVNQKIKKKNYMFNNVLATQNLIFLMKKLKINKIIFSSTAAVYAKNSKFLNEKQKLKPISNYGKSKLIAEKLIKNNKNIKYVILRFFNVSGCIVKPLLGEFHNPETHLIPISVYSAVNEKKINIFGNNYETKDGTCVRDYVHVKDICSAIKNSIRFLKKNKSTIVNIGNGKGTSNNEVILKLKKIIKKNIKLNFKKKRQGDHPFLVCSISKAKKVLKWNPKFSKIENILKDEIKWSKFLIKRNIKRKYQIVQK
tara:strand:+ start:2286 stop:3272 length:987 start_codon:yes stop_codon:yes gene_type:complete